MTYKRLTTKTQYSEGSKQKYRKSDAEEYSDSEIANSSKNTGGGNIFFLKKKQKKLFFLYGYYRHYFNT
jgi:thioredoxin-related protein